MTPTTKKAKSVLLLPQELKSLKKYCKKFTTQVDASLSLGIDRNVLVRLLAMGSGSEVTVSRVREVLSKSA